MKPREELSPLIRFFVKKKKQADVAAPVTQAPLAPIAPSPSENTGAKKDLKAKVQDLLDANDEKPSFFARFKKSKNKDASQTESVDSQQVSQKPKKKKGFSGFKFGKKKAESEEFALENAGDIDAANANVSEEVITAVDVKQQIDNSLGRKIAIQFVLFILLISASVATQILFVTPLQNTEAQEARKLRTLEKNTRKITNDMQKFKRQLNQLRQEGAQKVQEIRPNAQNQALLSNLRALARDYRVTVQEPISWYRDPDVDNNQPNIFGATGIIYRVRVEMEADFFDYLQMREQLYNRPVNFVLLNEIVTAQQNNPKQQIVLELRTVEIQ